VTGARQRARADAQLESGPSPGSTSLNPAGRALSPTPQQPPGEAHRSVACVPPVLAHVPPARAGRDRRTRVRSAYILWSALRHSLMKLFRSSPLSDLALASVLHFFIFSCWVIGMAAPPFKH
jgi:hypothetical protein